MTFRKTSPRLGLLILALLVGFGVRVLILYHNTRQLAAVNGEFPRDYYAGATGDPGVTYIAMGDSTAQGTGAGRLQQTLPYLIAQQIAAHRRRVHVIVLAKSGARMHDVILGQIPQVQRLHPDLVTLNCGANDATHFTPLADYEADLKTCIRELAATSARKIVVATPPDMSVVPALPPVYNTLVGRRCRQESDLLVGIAPEPKLQIVDLFHNGKLTRSDQYASDDFHPSAAGYALWAVLYRPIWEQVSFSSQVK